MNTPPPTTVCQTADQGGTIEQLYINRLCDNKADCPNNEDEGDIATCLTSGGQTARGCCERLMINGVLCLASS